MLCLVFASSVALAEPLRLAVAEVGTASGSLSHADGVQTRLEWSRGRSMHVGFQGSWNGGADNEAGEFYLGTPSAPDARLDSMRALATVGYHLDDRRLQVGLGVAAGPSMSVARDFPAYDPIEESWTTYSGTDTVLAAFWITSIRIRIADNVGVYLGVTGDLTSVAADGSFGIGWTR